MLRISKIVFCKFIETLQELLYTPLATCFSDRVSAYARSTKLPILFPIYQVSDFQSFYLGHTIHKAILDIKVLSSPTDHRNGTPEDGRAPPLRI
jgi:hypothetical protein